ncbi:MAG: hypothetical protein FJ271_09185 [Planctomycetes bacterium]|nr:hypothetical protein [Planctomycetota bacterium]
MTGQNARLGSLLILLVVGCAPLGTWLGKETAAGKFDTFSKIKLGMIEWEVETMLGGKKGTEFFPDGWPRIAREVPDLGFCMFPNDKIRWVYWRVKGPHQWIAIGTCRRINAASLTMSEIVIKKSGLNGPDLPPGASP